MVQDSTFEVHGLKAQFEQDLEKLKRLVAVRDREGDVQQLKAMMGWYWAEKKFKVQGSMRWCHWRRYRGIRRGIR